MDPDQARRPGRFRQGPGSLPGLDRLREEGPALTAPFFRESGSGPGVVCLHSNASTSGQWRALSDLLAPKFRVFAVDSYGSGKSPDWTSDRVITFADEAALIEPVLERAGAPLVLVGHSFGAAIALKAALQNPGRVRAIAIYEPTLFWLIDAAVPPPNDADGIRNVARDAGLALDAGDPGAAARRFLDFWMGEGTWERTPEKNKPPIAESARNIRRWWHAASTEPTPLSAFRALGMPVLYMGGGRSPASAQGVGSLLTGVLPRVERVVFPELGHMGPITHPGQVNAAIESFLTFL